MPSNDPNTLLAILNKLEAKRGQSAAAAKRRYQRFVVRGEALIYPMDSMAIEQAPISAMLRDVALNGVGFVIGQELPVDSIWRVGFVNRGSVVGHQGIVVRHCEEIQAGSAYLVGCMFTIEIGLLGLLGVDTSDCIATDHRDVGYGDSFLAPGEVA